MSEKFSLPEHRNPGNNRKAHAPYNFIPLPDQLVGITTPEVLPDHDQYDTARHNGYIDVMLEVRTPIYIRAPLTEREFNTQDNGDYPGKDTVNDPYKNNPDFFYTEPKTKAPVIPAPSLRGMIRNVIE